jgi:2-phospho-L-lactate guanylyltransferase
VRIAALVPVKHLGRAKKRLDGVLTPDQRRGLVIAMLKDVLAVLTGHRGLDAVHVVTPDETVAAIARQFGARVIDEPPGGGLNAALRHAAERLGGDGFEAAAVAGRCAQCRCRRYRPFARRGRTGAVRRHCARP